MIDPACGSGHFLLGAFPRILRRWQEKEPGTKVDVLVQRTLDSIHGVDINPFAIAIARFRLLLAALKACGIERLADAIDFDLSNLACGDSLYHGRQKQGLLADWTDESHYFQTEDADNLKRILAECTFHAVVANPPYITPRDKAANRVYRELFVGCHRQYSLAIPFVERIFQLACQGEAAGFTGQITSNSFMTREFGKKLISEVLPSLDLTHIVDTKWADIPGHTTPTVLIFGRNRRPTSDTIRTVMGIKGDPTSKSTGDDGVWNSMVGHIDIEEFEDGFITVKDLPRRRFSKHPWSISGGGASTLKSKLDDVGKSELGRIAEEFGIASWAGIDEPFTGRKAALRRRSWPHGRIWNFVSGDVVRDWQIFEQDHVAVPYNADGSIVQNDQFLPFQAVWWNFRKSLNARVLIGGKTVGDETSHYYTWVRWINSRYSAKRRIVFAFIATHNHFVIDEGGNGLNRSVPIIILNSTKTHLNYEQVLAFLNSSTVCFWMKQVCYPKGSTTGDISVESGKAEANRYEFSITALSKIPIPDERNPIWNELESLGKRQVELSNEISKLENGKNLFQIPVQASAICRAIEQSLERCVALAAEMRLIQEEIDWKTYQLFGLAANSSSHSEREVEKSNSKNLRLLESPLFKRPWNGRQGVYGTARSSPAARINDALKEFLVAKLESYFDFDGRLNDEGRSTVQDSLADPRLISVSQLADIASADEQFSEVAEVYRDRSDFDFARLIHDLVSEEHVPALPVLRYKPTGLDKRDEWERTWELQRDEDVLSDQISAIRDQLKTAADKTEKEKLNADQQRLTAELNQLSASISVPPTYKSSDMISSDGLRVWKLRGKLDVPKERWVSFPHCEGEDQTLVIAWAGYDHLQLTRAIAAFFADVQERGGSTDPRLVPLLAAMDQQIPWVKQWHNDIDPEFGMRMGDYFESFIADEARTLGLTVEDIRNWEPPKTTPKKKATTKKASKKVSKKKTG